MIEHHQRGATTAPLARTIGSKTGISWGLEYHAPSRYALTDNFSVTGEKLKIREFLRVHAETMVDDVRPVPKGAEAESNGSLPFEDEMLSSTGKGNSVPEGVRTMLGETVERYAMYTGSSPYVRSSYAALSDEAELVDFEYLDLYSEQRLNRIEAVSSGLDTLTRNEKRLWAIGRDLLTGEPTYLPWSMIFTRTYRGKQSLLPVTTNGMACHDCVATALLNSIYEYVERDAFMKAWFTETPPARITSDRFTAENRKFELHLLKYRTGVELPIVGAVVLNKHDDFPAGFIGGSSAASCASEAIESTFHEAGQMSEYISYPTITDRSDEIDPDDITNLDDNIIYYFNPDHVEPLVEFLQGDCVSDSTLSRGESFSDPDDELSHVLETLADEGVTPIAFDVTPPDVRAEGLVVTRVVIPELVPLSFPSFPFDAHPALEGAITNDSPHPFP